MIFIHAADLHLGSPLGGLDRHDQLPVQQIRHAPMRSFERLAELCISRGAAVLVIAGDLFDGDADLATMREAASILGQITRAGAQVVTIRGNHDAQSKMQRRMPSIDGLHHLPTSEPGTVLLPDLGIAIHGQGFDSPKVEDNIVTHYPPPVPGVVNVGLLHTSLGGAPGHDSYAPCSVSDLAAKSYQYWALGHVHKRQVVSTNPWVIYPGNTQGRDVGETGPRGATVVSYADGQIVGEPEHVNLDDVRWSVLQMELDEEESAEELLRRAMAQLDVIVGAAPDVVHLVRVKISGRGVAHAELDERPGVWAEQLHTAALEVSADRLYLEQIKIDTQPALPDTSELLAREDFVGDVARILMGDPESLNASMLNGGFDVVKKQLAKLPGVDVAALVPDVSDTDIKHASDALLSRMLTAHAADIEASR